MISVIVPAYNAAAFLTPTLDSVVAQTYTDWELLVVDDGSRDDTRAIAEAVAARDARVRVLTKENGGCAAARNFGFAHVHAASEYVIFLDHDDFWEPDALHTLLHAAETLPQAAAAVGGVSVMEGAEAGKSSRRFNTERPCFTVGAQAKQAEDTAGSRHEPITLAGLLLYCPICTMGQTLVRRSAFEAVGQLDPHTAPADDWDLYLRLTLQAPLATTDKVVVHWRSHETNTSKNQTLMRQAEERVRAKLLARTDLRKEQRHWIESSVRNPKRFLSTRQLQWARECAARKDFAEALKQARFAAVNYVHSLGGSKA